MSNTDGGPVLVSRGGREDTPAGPTLDVLPGREVMLGGSTVVRRLLPTLGRRLVGAWCFVDHYGPDDVAERPGMQVPPHPHIGLQTVSWLLDGAVHHLDSLGSDVLIRPGQLGLMTAGRAIAHSERSPVPHPALLHGAQLWVALPDGARSVPPAFEHHERLPVLGRPGLRATVLLGELAGARSPGTAYSPLVGADLVIDGDEDVHLPLDPDFEYAVLVATGEVEVAGAVVGPGSLVYLGTGRADLRLRARPAGRLLLLGGEPFAERIVMWWNFVARTGEEVAEAREDWMAGRRFGPVAEGEPLPAPALPATRLLPRGRRR
ncbi:MAG TPA: pirin family protein [Pseudonocardia sp.]